MGSTVRHSVTVRLLHWATAALILAQLIVLVFASTREPVTPFRSDWIAQVHLSLEVAVLFFVVSRLVLKTLGPGHWAPPVTTGWMAISATVHSLLYITLLVLPVFGYLRLAALEIEPQLFGFLTLPALPLNVPLSKMARDTHDAAAIFLAVLVAFHVSGAVLHKRFFGTNVLNRMLFGKAV